MRQLGENAVDEKMALGHFDHWRFRRLLPRGGGREEGRDEEEEQQRRQGARHHEAEGVAVDENSMKSILVLLKNDFPPADSESWY